jgi:hypothetical protein
MGKEAEKSDVRIRLHRVADQMGDALECLVKDAEVPGQRTVAVDIARGPYLLCDTGHRDLFAVEFAVFVFKKVHLALLLRSE